MVARLVLLADSAFKYFFCFITVTISVGIVWFSNIWIDYNITFDSLGYLNIEFHITFQYPWKLIKGVDIMPLVKIEILKGKSPEYKKALLDGVHKALVDCFKIPDYDRNQRLYELDRENFEFSSNKTENFVLIELTVFKGRSYEAKKSLYKAIVDNLEKALGIKRTDVLIVIHEPPLENWGVAGGVPASEVDLGFKVDV